MIIELQNVIFDTEKITHIETKTIIGVPRRSIDRTKTGLERRYSTVYEVPYEYRRFMVNDTCVARIEINHKSEDALFWSWYKESILSSVAHPRGLMSFPDVKSY